MRWRPWWHTLTALQRTAVICWLAGLLWITADAVNGALS